MKTTTSIVTGEPSARPTPSSTSRLRARLQGLVPDIRLLAFVFGGLLVLGFLMGFDLPAR